MAKVSEHKVKRLNPKLRFLQNNSRSGFIPRFSISPPAIYNIAGYPAPTMAASLSHQSLIHRLTPINLNNMKYFLCLLFVLGIASASIKGEPVKIGIVGMSHGHVNGLLRSGYESSLKIVGFYEADVQVAKKYQLRYDLAPDLFVNDLETFLDEQSPSAVWVFSNTFDHLKIVEVCAPRGVHVIVEKPLAIDKASAVRMMELSRKHGTHVLTNLETTWYSSLHEAYRLAIEEKKLGKITKIVSHFGHSGPANMAPEFFKWLSDPYLNGGGASADFGCYGHNIITWMMGNQRPLSVTAIFQTNKPDVYREVDDNATIILEYPNAQGIIQASWDWPFPRKDVHIYGRGGIIRTIDEERYDIRLERRESPAEKSAIPLKDPYSDSISYFSAVLRGEIDPRDSLSSMENNLIAMEIMEAAKLSAETGKKVRF